jgi:hypothetical protein
MIWLFAALIIWPVASVLVALGLGRLLASCETTAPRWSPGLWVRRELPRSVVAPLPPERDLTHI